MDYEEFDEEYLEEEYLDEEEEAVLEYEEVEEPPQPGLAIPIPMGLAIPFIGVIVISLMLVCLSTQIDWAQAAALTAPQSLPAAASARFSSNTLSHGAQTILRSEAAGGLPALFTPEVRYWEKEIIQWARDYNLDPLWVATVMQIESCGHAQAVSRSGAMGLFQVMPYHFQAGEDGFAPAVNALRGLDYLRRSLNAHQGDIRLALAGYNAGISGSSRPETAWPAETKRYVYWGMGIYEDAAAGKEHSPRLQEWLQAGGKSLCEQARQALDMP